jgi:PAS domain S-box-containing protein
MGTALLVFWGDLAGGKTPPAVTWTNIVIVVVCLGLRRWMQTGQVKRVGVVLIALGITLTTGSIAQLGTIRTPSTALFLLVIVVAGLLFNVTGLLIVTGLSSLAVAWLIMAEAAGLLPVPDYSVTVTQWSTYTAIFVAGGGLMYYYINTIHLTLARAEQELTERKQAEAELRKSEDKFKHVFDHSPIGKSITLVDGEINVNQAFCEMLGYSPQELKSRKWQEITHPDDIELTQDTINALLCGAKEAARFMKRYLHKNGSVVWAEVSTSLRRDQDGNPLYFMTTIGDITERKEAEEALRESAMNLARSQRVGKLGSWGWNVAGNSLVWSEELYRTWGVGKDFALTFENIAGLIHPDDRELNGNMVQELLASRDAGEFEFRILCPDGTVKWIHQGIEVARDPSGQPMRMFGIMQDVTERKQAEKALQEYNSRLETAVKARTSELREAQEQLVRQEKLAVLGQLAGGVGHELRNPLTVILNAVYYLKLVQGDANDKIRQYHGMIEQEAHNAEKIITDLLDFARIKSVDREPVAVPELVQRVLERFPAPQSVAVTFDWPPDLPKVFVDPRQIEQVLGNLVVNACQAMNSVGKLSVVSEQLSVDGIAWVRIAVKDTGVGIPPETMQKIFEPLFTTKTKGIGLGLAVSKKLVEANGGRIEVESAPGQGSIFTVFLPISM